MSSPVVPGLSFLPDHSPLLSPGQLFLITDHLASPANFLLHRILANHLKDIKYGRVILVSFASEFAQWRAIAAKSNINLSQFLTSKSLVYIDGMSLSSYKAPSDSDSREQIACPPLLNAGDPSLRGLYNLIAQSLHDDPSHPPGETPSQKTVIIDDITLLELIGVPDVALIRFVRALRALCQFQSASLIVRAHASAVSETDLSLGSHLLRCLLDSSHVYVEVRPLSSGKSGAVSGEIAIHRGHLSLEDGTVDIGRDAAVQYRLSDGGAVFFQKGMAVGML